MKIIALLTILITMGFIACKKSDPSPDSPASSAYYITATINGTNVTYSNYTGAVNRAVGFLNIYGYNSNAINTADGISLMVNNVGINTNFPIIIGAYTDTNNIYRSNINNYWNPYSAGLTLQQSGTDYENDGAMDDTTLNPFTCVITAIDSVSVSGTFSGSVYVGFGSTGETITNGSFKIPF